MTKLLTNHQIKVIMTLNLALIVMFTAVLLTLNSKASDGVADLPPAHNLVRAARLSANQDIMWETNIGGSGCDQVIGAFTLYERIYIFGNTTSADYDFVGSGGAGFCAVIMPSGNTKSFTVYPFSIAKVSPTLNGFALCCNVGETAALKLINSDGVVTGGAILSPTVKQRAIDLYIDSQNYYLVTTYFNTTTNKNTIFVNSYSSKLTHNFEYAFNCAYDLQYINILPYGQSLMLCANVVSSTANYLAMVLFDRLNVPVFKYITSSQNYFCYNVMPYDNGYAALANVDGIPQIMTITNSFKQDITKHLNSDTASGCSMFFANNNYYSFVKPTNGSAVLTQMNSSLVSVKNIDSASDFTYLHDTFQASKASYILASTESKLKILALATDGSTLAKQIATTNESGGKIIPLNDGILIVANSTAKSPDVGGNFGDTDVWIAKIRF